jgi:hypothetical protein
MTDEEKKKAREKKYKRIAIVVGMVLALVCKSLPPDYQVVCDTIAQVCRGGI